jgi:hypothetical protein
MTMYDKNLATENTRTLFIPAHLQINKAPRPTTTGQFPALKAAAFTVIEKPLFAEDLSMDALSPGQVVLIPPSVGKLLARSDNDHSLGVVGGRYYPVQNSTLHAAVERSLRAELPSNVTNTTELTEKISRSGSFIRLEYRIPHYSGVIQQLNGTTTNVDFMIIFQNTHGGASVRMKAASVDRSCDNVLVYGLCEEASAQHTENFSTKTFEEYLRNEVRHFKGRINEMRGYAKKSITTQQARAALSGNKLLSAEQLNKVMAQFDDEIVARGSTAWALYAAITSFSSHNNERFRVRNSANTDNEAEALAKREDTVMKIIASPAFQAVAA